MQTVNSLSCTFFFFDKWVVLKFYSLTDKIEHLLKSLEPYRAIYLEKNDSWAVTYPAFKWIILNNLIRQACDLDQMDEDEYSLKSKEQLEELESLPSYNNSYAFGSEEDLKRYNSFLHSKSFPDYSPFSFKKEKKQTGFIEGETLPALSHLVGKKVRALPCRGFKGKTKEKFGGVYVIGTLEPILYSTYRVEPDAVVKTEDGLLYGVSPLTVEPLQEKIFSNSALKTSPKSVSKRFVLLRRVWRTLFG